MCTQVSVQKENKVFFLHKLQILLYHSGEGRTVLNKTLVNSQSLQQQESINMSKLRMHPRQDKAAFLLPRNFMLTFQSLFIIFGKSMSKQTIILNKIICYPQTLNLYIYKAKHNQTSVKTIILFENIKLERPLRKNTDVQEKIS